MRRPSLHWLLLSGPAVAKPESARQPSWVCSVAAGGLRWGGGHGTSSEFRVRGPWTRLGGGGQAAQPLSCSQVGDGPPLERRVGIRGPRARDRAGSPCPPTEASVGAWRPSCRSRLRVSLCQAATPPWLKVLSPSLTCPAEAVCAEDGAPHDWGPAPGVAPWWSGWEGRPERVETPRDASPGPRGVDGGGSGLGAGPPPG